MLPAGELPVVLDALPRSLPPLPTLEIFSEEPCSSRPRARTPRLPPRSQGTFPTGQDWGQHGILQDQYLCPGRTHGGAGTGGTSVSADDAHFSIRCRALPSGVSLTTQQNFALSAGAPAWLSLLSPNLQGKSNSPRSCFSVWQRNSFVRGCLAQAVAGVYHLWVRAGCACLGRSHCSSCVSGGYCARC